MTNCPITIRWIAKFTYPRLCPLLFVDHFVMNDQWPYIEVVVGNRVVSLGYMDKQPQIEYHQYPLLLFSKYRIFKLTEEHGQVIVSTQAKEAIAIPGLSFTEITFEPYTSLVQFPFDFHTMLVIMDTSPEGVILESNTPALTRATVIYRSLKIDVVEGTLSFSSEKDHPLFYTIAKDLEYRYHLEGAEIRALFDRLDTPQPPPGRTHFAMDYEVWYRGSRENQRVWPLVQRHPPDLLPGSLFFHGLWYLPPEGKGYVGLSLRHDDNPHLYIPRCYLKPPAPSTFTIPVAVRQTCKRYGALLKAPYASFEGQPYLLVDKRGVIIECSEHPEVMVYNHRIIATLKDKPSFFVSCEAQLLDRHFQRARILIGGVWQDAPGVRLHGVITIPWYYRQIIHDYHRLGRLRIGPLMDLSHIGIVDPEADDIITFPADTLETLYIAPSLETHRLCTFKYKYGVYESFRLIQRNEERSR